MSNNPVVYGLTNPLQLIVGPPIEAERDPNSNDALNYPNGQQWMVSGTMALWELVLGTWTLIGNASTGDVQTLTGNSGGTVGPDMAGNIDVVGDGVTVDVVGSPGSNTLTISAMGSVAIDFDTDAGTATPAANTLNILGGTGCATTGAGSTVTINVDGSIASQYTTDAGVAAPIANNLNVLGGTGVSTVGVTDTITINASADVATSYETDAGTATPSANVLQILGGTNTATSAAGNVVTIDVTVPSSDLEFVTDSGTATSSMGSINFFGAGGTMISGAGDTVTVTSTGGGTSWVEVTGTTQAMAVDTGYVANNVAQVDLTLPSTAAFGSMLRVVGKGSGGWTISQNASQQIFFLTDSTTVGVAGTLTPDEDISSIELVCTTADLEFTVLSATGNFTLA